MLHGLVTLALLGVAAAAVVQVVAAAGDRRAPADPSVGSIDQPPGSAQADDGAPGAEVPADVTQAIVTSITDGDTLRVDVDGRNEPVRLLELDTPEVTGDCGAASATAALAELAPVGSRVWLQSDVKSRDRYGRLLRYLWRDDGVMVNRALVRRGWARAKLYPPNERHWPMMRRAGKLAQRRDAGLWKQCDWGGRTSVRPVAPDTSPGQPVPCDPNYSGCVPRYPPDVDCSRIDGPVNVLGSDPHNLDGDGDRRACEPLPG